MIAIHKVTLGDDTIFNMPTLELIETVKNGRIDDEVIRLRELYGDELEMVKSDMDTVVCLVYDDVKWYVSKV